MLDMGLRAGWRSWNHPAQVIHLRRVAESWTSKTACAVCFRTGFDQVYCPGCEKWTCLACANLQTLVISKVQWCVACKVQRLRLYRTETEPPSAEWLERMARLESGCATLANMGGAYRFRASVLRNITEWGAREGLEVLPGSPPVYEQYITHRLLYQCVSIATVKQDFIGLSVWHSLVKAAIPGLQVHNPAKQDLIRIFIKQLLREVRPPAVATQPIPVWQWVAMVKSLSRDRPQELHARIVLQVLGWGALRPVAAFSPQVTR